MQNHTKEVFGMTFVSRPGLVSTRKLVGIALVWRMHYGVDMKTQLTFGALSGMETVKPFAVGDVLVKADGSRFVVQQIDTNTNGQVFVCVNLQNGNSAILLEKEITYRSK